MTPRTHIIGAGLIGASIGIGLTAEGWRVTIADADPETERIAKSIGAGGALADAEPELVIVATPPAVASAVVVDALQRWPHAIVTDVSSVKAPILEAAAAAGASSRYVGSHPMAGREVSGALHAQGDLFRARPWVICQGDANDDAVALVRSVAERGAEVMRCATMLFLGMVDDATTFAETRGGGGGGSDLKWGRDEDEDNRAWALRCMRMASRMMRPSIGKKPKR